MHDALRGVAGLGLVDTERALALLATYATLLREVAVPRGFVAAGDRERVVERHVLDAIRAARALVGRLEIADLGSGAGLPGIPLAIVRPDARVTLIESRRPRGAFLEFAAEELGLTNVRVEIARVEDLEGGAFEAATARAFAPLERAWEVGRGLLRPGGRLVAFGGRGSVVPDTLPGASSVVSEAPVLESEGPLIIITR